MLESICDPSIQRLVNEALSDEVLCSRALELGLDQHPRLAGRVPAQQMGSALLAVCRASYSHHQSSEAFTRLVRLIMDPILKKMAADATSQGRNVPMRERTLQSDWNGDASN